MIPYDDLVAALQAWRARQGLPVAASHAGSAPVPAATAPQPGSGPKPTVPRSNPPQPPGRQMPLAAPVDDSDVEDAGELIDEQAYENEGDDFALAFGQKHDGDVEQTEIGGAPARPSERTDPSGRGDW